MRFDTGFFDGLFGKRVTLHLTAPDGSPRKVSVTEKWLAQQEQQGKITQRPDIVTVQIADPIRGCYETTWTIGKEIDAETVKNRLDPKTGNLYVIVIRRNGEAETYVSDPGTWAKVKREMDAIGGPPLEPRPFSRPKDLERVRQTMAQLRREGVLQEPKETD